MGLRYYLERERRKASSLPFLFLVPSFSPSLHMGSDSSPPPPPSLPRPLFPGICLINMTKGSTLPSSSTYPLLSFLFHLPTVFSHSSCFSDVYSTRFLFSFSFDIFLCYKRHPWEVGNLWRALISTVHFHDSAKGNLDLFKVSSTLLPVPS